MTDNTYSVAIIGCGRLGQHYAEVYQTLPNTELVAIAEYNPERLSAVGQRFGVTALYTDAEALFRDITPDIAAVVLPGSRRRWQYRRDIPVQILNRSSRQGHRNSRCLELARHRRRRKWLRHHLDTRIVANRYCTHRATRIRQQRNRVL